MRTFDKLVSAAALGAVVSLGYGPSVATEMKIGFVTINDSQHFAANWLTEELPKRTGGALQPKVFPVGQLGTIPRQIENMQLGVQEMFISPPGFFVGLNKAFQAADAPALFNDADHQNRTLNHETVRDKFLALGESKGVKGLTVWSAGGGAFATLKPVKKIADLRGQKIRVLASPMERAMMQAIGAAGTPMDYTEVLNALQYKALDGARSAIVVMGPSKFYTVTKFITLENGSFIPSVMWVSAAWWKKLPADQQRIVQEAVREVTPMAQAKAIEITTSWETKWTEEGGTVIRFEPDEQKKLMDIYRPLGDQILGKDPAIAPMYELVKTAAKLTM